MEKTENTEKVEQVGKVSLFKRITNHVEKHKVKYGVGAGVCAVIVGIGYNAFNKSGNEIKLPKITTRGFNNVVRPIMNNINNDITIKLESQDQLERIIRCVETGELFLSQSKAAESMNISAKKLSEYLNGKRDDAGGYTFERLKDTLRLEE